MARQDVEPFLDLTVAEEIGCGHITNSGAGRGTLLVNAALQET